MPAAATDVAVFKSWWLPTILAGVMFLGAVSQMALAWLNRKRDDRVKKYMKARLDKQDAVLEAIAKVSETTDRLHCKFHADGVTPRCFVPSGIEPLLKEVRKQIDETSDALAGLLKSQERGVANQEGIIKAMMSLKAVLEKLRETLKF
jgi:NurA-like 5'-3' nuclease